jgi:hypothetical protein
VRTLPGTSWSPCHCLRCSNPYKPGVHLLDSSDLSLPHLAFYQALLDNPNGFLRFCKHTGQGADISGCRFLALYRLDGSAAQPCVGGCGWWLTGKDWNFLKGKTYPGPYSQRGQSWNSKPAHSASACPQPPRTFLSLLTGPAPVFLSRLGRRLSWAGASAPSPVPSCPVLWTVCLLLT